MRTGGATSAELAAERLPELDGQERTALVQEITDVRSGIESWVLRRWEEVGGSWSRADAESAETHVRTAYPPWVDERNAEHAVSQATYYAGTAEVSGPVRRVRAVLVGSVLV